jgi:hypothetical protein
LLVNNANTWRLRPEAATAIPNFVLASDYVRTYTDLATMEGANEAARRAVNAILDRSGSEQPRCRIWNLHEPDALAPLRAYDRARYQGGLPWDGRFSKAVQAALAMGQDATGVTAGGAGPLATVSPVADALAAAGGALADPTVARALSLIGPPPGLVRSAADSAPGLGAAAPGADVVSAAAAAVAPWAAAPSFDPSPLLKETGVGLTGAPSRPRIRIRQKS